MFNLAGRLIFTSTAIAPVGFTYAWAAWQSDRNTALSIAFTAIALWIVALIFLDYADSNFERQIIKPTEVEAADRESLSFLLLYLAPLFTDSFSDLNWGIIAPALVVFAIVTATGYSYHFNPLLGIMRWHFYKVSTSDGVTYVVVTKRQLRNVLGSLKVVQISEYILMEVDKR